MLALYSFHWDCRRMGDVTGLFIADKETVKTAIGKEVYFGEILGKHSDIYGTLGEEDLLIKSEDQEFIKTLKDIIGSTHISGYNPLDYLEEEEAEDDL